MPKFSLSDHDFPSRQQVEHRREINSSEELEGKTFTFSLDGLSLFPLASWRGSQRIEKCPGNEDAITKATFVIVCARQSKIEFILRVSYVICGFLAFSNLKLGYSGANPCIETCKSL